MKTPVTVACLVVILSRPLRGSTAPDTEPASEAEVRELMELTGTSKNLDMVAAKTIPQMRDLLEKELPANPRKQEILDGFFAKSNPSSKPMTS